MMNEIYCDKCKHEFILKESDFRIAKVNCKNKLLSLQYFSCPKCNEIYKVLLFDEKSDELREDIEKTQKRIRRNFGSNNTEFASRLNGMLNAKIKRLKQHNKELNAKYSGTFTFDVSENNSKEQTIKYLP